MHLSVFDFQVAYSFYASNKINTMSKLFHNYRWQIKPATMIIRTVEWAKNKQWQMTILFIYGKHIWAISWFWKKRILKLNIYFFSQLKFGWKARYTHTDADMVVIDISFPLNSRCWTWKVITNRNDNQFGDNMENYENQIVCSMLCKKPLNH